MKVHIGKHVRFISCYTIAEKILFWMDRDDDRIVALGDWLSSRGDKKSLLRKFLEWNYTRRKRTVKIHIDPYDIWDMEYTLSLIILPMLENLRKNKIGSAIVDNEDVPEELRTLVNYTDLPGTNSFAEKEDHLIHKRWEYILDEMIFAFEFKVNHREEEFYREAGFDIEGFKVVNARAQRGYELFGKYFQNLWT